MTKTYKLSGKNVAKALKIRVIRSFAYSVAAFALKAFSMAERLQSF